MRNLVIVDAGLGNLRSVQKAVLEAAGKTNQTVLVHVSADLEQIRRADQLIVPGQGGFQSAARALSGGLGEVLREQLKRGTPYFGICLGLQILFESSEEAAGPGLAWFRGSVARLRAEFTNTKPASARIAEEPNATSEPAAQRLPLPAPGAQPPPLVSSVKIPHMGWNQIELREGPGAATEQSPRTARGFQLLREAGGSGTWFYFVHSYHALPADSELILATCEHGTNQVTAAIGDGQVFATQFHPEKSQAAGSLLLRKFLEA